ncbi:MAG: hypothetical protein PHF86_05245 [Candidatus Nanoarchaeia archaeon]|nr:hypothetical protein [Candidatus Nanoarchaeia archaeon]
MNTHFEKAFEKLDECMDLLGKGINSIFKEVAGKDAKETKINIKAGSVVYVGKGVYARLLKDTEATVSSISEEPEAVKSTQ